MSLQNFGHGDTQMSAKALRVVRAQTVMQIQHGERTAAFLPLAQVRARARAPQYLPQWYASRPRSHRRAPRGGPGMSLHTQVDWSGRSPTDQGRTVFINAKSQCNCTGSQNSPNWSAELQRFNAGEYTCISVVQPTPESGTQDAEIPLAKVTMSGSTSKC